MLRATVSGSFHRHMAAINEAVGELRVCGVEVLSPADPRVVDHAGEFLFVASDKLRSVRLVQDRHFAAICASDFLWVVCPDGYTGASTCMEVAWALAAGVPVFSSAPIRDVTVAEYVDPAPSIANAIERVSRRSIPLLDHVLLDPAAGIDLCVRTLEGLRPVLLGNEGNRQSDADRLYNRARKTIKSSLAL